VVLDGGGGVCHQGGVKPWASSLISGSPTLGSCWARWLDGLGGSAGKCLKTPIERGSEARFRRGGANHAPIFLVGWGLT
jgi:hypothetical protein